jgi:hypothetical protein
MSFKLQVGSLVEVQIFANSVFSRRSGGRKIQSTLNTSGGLLLQGALWKIEDVFDHLTADA